MSEKHTPGPWRYDKQSGYIWGKSVGGCGLTESEHLVAEVRGWGHLQYLPNGAVVQDANGLLIAAAPDLLEALQGMLSLEESDLRGYDDTDVCKELEDARAAIAKATGNE